MDDTLIGRPPSAAPRLLAPACHHSRARTIRLFLEASPERGGGFASRKNRNVDHFHCAPRVPFRVTITRRPRGVREGGRETKRRGTQTDDGRNRDEGVEETKRRPEKEKGAKNEEKGEEEEEGRRWKGGKESEREKRSRSRRKRRSRGRTIANRREGGNAWSGGGSSQFHF